MLMIDNVDALLKWRSSCPPHRIFAIIGPPGSGKSTLADELSRRLVVPHVVIPMDGFHYPQARLAELGRRDRMGAPDTFDTIALADSLKLVHKRSSQVRFPGFDRAVEEPVPDQILVDPAHKLVVLEGNYLLLDDEDWKPIGDLIDLAIYIDIPDDLRISRLIQRHCDFGKSMDDATEWVHRVDEANAKVIRQSATRAAALYRPGGSSLSIS